MNPTVDRRAFLRAAPFVALAGTLLPRPLAGLRAHPDPRPGIDGSDVLSGPAIEAFGPDVAEVYDMIRAIPGIADGLACYCGCSAFPNYRSLLTCYHAGGMAMGCQICQGEARLAYGRAREGQDLEQIRRAIDARYAR